MDKIFGILWASGLVNSHTLNQDQFDTWSLYTFLPYQIDCFTLAHHKLESFTLFNYTENSNLSIDELYPKKLGNFKQCPLYFAPSYSSPCVMNTASIRDKELGRPPKLEGIDVSILEQFAKLVNYTIVFKNANLKPGQRPILNSIFSNGTLQGNLGLVRYFLQCIHFLGLLL